MQFKEEERLMLKDIQDKRILMEQQMRDKEEYERNTRQAEALQNKKDLIQRIKSNQTSFDEEMASLDKELEQLKAADKTTLKIPAGTGGGEDHGNDGDSEDSSEDSALSKVDAESTRREKKPARPTKAQMAARNGITRRLPNFDGKHEDCPLFYGTYCASNEACGYTDVENLVRLQECLKDQALAWVKGQLIMPKTVLRAIAKLKL
ncbi:hypothetical protein pipiens_008199, partial [Culex pipiens pipiens]